MIYTDLHGRGEPPLSQWESPWVDEPAHGYLVRMASLNHRKSVKTLAETFGFNGRDLQPKECLEFALSLPAEHKERLIRATPIVTNKSVELMGEAFKPRDWSVGRRFFCPACLAEDGYHRCYWDLTAFKYCPFHEIPTSCTDNAGRPMPWWCPSFSHSPHGNEIFRRGIPRRKQIHPSVESYILGRLGLADPLSVPIIDDLENMGDRLAAIRFIGRIVIKGQRRSTRTPKDIADEENEAALRAGFSEILKGEDGLRRVFEKLADAAPAERQSRSMKSLFGETYLVADKYADEFGNKCAQIMLDVAVGRGELSVKRYELLVKDTRWTTIADISTESALTRNCVRRIAEKLNLLEPKIIDRRLVVFDGRSAEIIRNTIATLLNRDGAAALLNISRSFFDGLVRANFIKRFIHTNSDRFRPEDILAFEKQIVSRAAKLEAVPPTGRLLSQLRCTSRTNPAQLVQEIIEGRYQVLGRLSYKFGDVVINSAQAPRRGEDGYYFVRKETKRRSISGFTKLDAAKVFGDGYETFVALIKAMKVQSVDRKIEPEVLAGICKKYAAARIYAPVLGCSLNKVRERLTALGVKIIPLRISSKRPRCVVDRESAKTILRLKQDPDVAEGSNRRARVASGPLYTFV